MSKRFLVVITLFVFVQTAAAQTSPSPTMHPTPAPSPSASPPPPRASVDLLDYGVRIEPEPRLIVMTAALEAAGLDQTPAGGEASVFRRMVKRDQSNLSADLRARLQTFYARNKLPEPAGPAEQAARYVSLALALGPAPNFEAPTRSDDLPSGLLEVLDFAPLVREFYRQSGIEERMPEYLRMARAEGDNLRRPVGELVRAVVSFLNTRVVTTVVERVPTAGPSSGSKKKDKPERKVVLTREKDRRFVVVPDLLAAPGTVNFRVIGDDYYAVVPYEFDPVNSDQLRRAYLQYVVDALALRFNKEIASRRAEIKMLLDERRTVAKADVSPDVFLAVTRSLVAAADARMVERARLNYITNITSERLRGAKTDAERAAITKDSREAQALAADGTVAQLADAYERGALLGFFFAEQLRGLETSGFNLESFLPDMINSFEVARERGRGEEYGAARARYAAARVAMRQEARAAGEARDASESARGAELVKGLNEVNELLRVKNYEEAETRLGALLREHKGDPRIFFALGQAASISAESALDENLQAERLSRALTHYRMAVESAAPDTDAALVARAKSAMERIQVFLDGAKKP